MLLSSAQTGAVAAKSNQTRGTDQYLRSGQKMSVRYRTDTAWVNVHPDSYMPVILAIGSSALLRVHRQRYRPVLGI